MWKTLLSLAQSVVSSVSIWVFIAGFGVGMVVCTDWYSDKMAEAELNAAVQRAEQGRRDYEKLIHAQNLADSLRRDAVDLRSVNDRLRRAVADRARATDAASADVERTQRAKCEGLLLRCSEALERGCGLLQDVAVTHDALVQAVQ